MALADRVVLAVLVTDQRPGSRSDAAAAVEILGRTDARLAGCVVNTPRRSVRRTAEPEGDTRSEWQHVPAAVPGEPRGRDRGPGRERAAPGPRDRLRRALPRRGRVGDRDGEGRAPLAPCSAG